MPLTLSVSIRKHSLMYFNLTQSFKNGVWKNISQNFSVINFTTQSPEVIGKIDPDDKITKNCI